MQTTRTFVAVVVPESLNARLARLQSSLAGELADLRWSTATPHHVTLAFLGDVENTDLNDVCRAVGAAASGYKKLELQLQGLGVFGTPEKPRVLWVGLAGSGLATLLELQGSIAAAVASAGYPHDEAVFRPHVTLGRFARGRRPATDVTALLNHNRDWSSGVFPITEVVTFASTLTPEGPVHAPLSRAPLRGRKGESAT